MNLLAKWCLGTLLLLPVMAAEKPRVMFGVVSDAAEGQKGLAVRAVHPDSPARKAGVQVGDVILSLNGTQVATREEMRALLRQQTPGNVLRVEVLQAGERRVIEVPLVARSERAAAGAKSPDAAVGGDRRLRPLVVDPAIREAMREHRRQVVSQLAAMPDSFAPAEVSAHLQAIRHLARDANPRGKGWMLGEAGEVSLQFKDAAGVLVLHGANKLLTLSVYDAEGRLTHTLPLNTPEECRVVPQEVMERLTRLR